MSEQTKEQDFSAEINSPRACHFCGLPLAELNISHENIYQCSTALQAHVTRQFDQLAALREQLALSDDTIESHGRTIERYMQQVASLQQFHDWAQPQIVTHGEDQLRIESLERDLHETVAAWTAVCESLKRDKASLERATAIIQRAEPWVGYRNAAIDTAKGASIQQEMRMFLFGVGADTAIKESKT